MADERSKCLGAGMNDHVAKPIELTELFAALVRWIRPEGEEAQDAAGLIETAGEEWFPASLPGIDLDQALNRVMGNGRLLRKIIVEFVKGNGMSVHMIADAVKGGDPEQALRLLHSFKGLAGNVGAGALFETARDLESALREKRLEATQALLETLAREMATVRESARMLEEAHSGSATASSAEPESLGAERVAELFKELAKLLSLNRMDAQKQFVALKGHLAGVPELETLEEKIDALDFKGALRCLKGIAATLNVRVQEQV
jgi:two-component system, sensor histidine kinase and response regulator